MHIVIMGCGRIGSMLAQGLEKRGYSVAVIDVSMDSFRWLGIDFQGTTVSEVGFDREVLEVADIRHTDGFAAVPSGDNSNILAAQVVREQCGVDNVVARVYDQGRVAVYERLGIPTVAIVRWTVGQVIRRLLPKDSEPVWRDLSRTVRSPQTYVRSAWVGKRIRDLSATVQAPIPLVSRTGRGIVPGSQIVFQDGDLVFVACETERTDDVESLFAAPPTRPRDL